jgi:multidrug efflux pump subunit AcrB
VEGISRINSTASEGVGVVFIELNLGEDVPSRLDEIKSEVDRITSFPASAEKPEVTEVTSRSRVIEIAVHGDVPERTLKELANRIKDDLSTMPEISYVQTSGVRDLDRGVERRAALVRHQPRRRSDRDPAGQPRPPGRAGGHRGRGDPGPGEGPEL